MTDKELRALDSELESGVMSEDEYLGILRNEVSRLHPEYEQLDIDNMFKMQLRILSLEEELAEDTCSEAISVIKHEFAKGSIRPDGQDEAAQLSDAKQEVEAAQPIEDLSGIEGIPEGNQEPAHPQKPNGNDPASSDGQQEPDKQDNDDQKDRQNDQDQQNDKQDKSKDKDKNKDKKKKKQSNWWWTWQIVPDWNEWMKDDDEEPETTADAPETSFADEFDKEDAITLTQQEDGTFSIPESEITHE